MSTRAHTAKAAVLAAVGAFVLSGAPAMAAARPSFSRYPIQGKTVPTRVIPVRPGEAIRMRALGRAIQAQAVGTSTPATTGRSLQDRMAPTPSS